MRRRVDLRWRIRPEEIERLRATQLELLRQAAPLLEARRHAGLQHVQPGAGGEPEGGGAIPPGNPGFKLEHERELLPFVDGVDGAFVARLMA